jgi:type I restriction enzyme S subunit
MIFEDVSFPPEWTMPKLGDVGAIRYGMGQPPEQSHDGVPMIRATNIKRGTISSEGLIRIKRSAIPESRNHFLIEGDVLVVRSGAYTGDSAMVTKAWAGSVAGYDLVLSLNNTVDPQYCAFVLLSREVQNYFKSQSARSAQPHLNRHQLESTVVPIPPLSEQRKIAGVLGLVQRAMEQQERLIEKTAELKKTLLHQLFTQGTRGEPQKQTDLGPVPESWEVGKIGDVAKTQSGGTPARDNPEYWQDGTIPWVKTGEIDYCVIEKTDEHITAKGLADSAAKLFPKGTLLMAMYGQGVTRGRVALLGIDATTNQACAAITPRSENQVSSRYLYSYLEFHYENLRKLGHGANQKNMNAALIRGFPLAVPKPDEQSDIVTALSSVEQKLAHHRRKHATLSALFRTLLHQLMTAQLRVHDLDLDGILSQAATEIQPP